MAEAGQIEGPSSLYQGGPWKFALGAARILPLGLAQMLAKTACQAYRLSARRRAEIIVANLRPVVDGEAPVAARRLFSRFAIKMIDLLRFEAGLAMESRFGELNGCEIFDRAHRRGGVLMVTPHLGNWEIGATLFARTGVKVFAVTQAEPGSNFTEIRKAARARWGVETIVVGQDAFAFVEIIKALQAGHAVALLIDRPAPQSAVEVKLFGRPFNASVAPGELARASGCAVLGTCIVEENGHYNASFLPEFEYDRRAMGNRQARSEFAQKIMTAFEPWIQKYADQWYHFVPIWK